MRSGLTTKALRATLLVLATSVAAACDDDPAGPTIDQSLVVGSYTLQTLVFDPQGSLGAMDIAAKIGAVPELVLSVNREAQIVYRDPATNLVRTIAGTFRTTETGVRIDFADADAAGSLLLPQRLELEYNGAARTLRFEGQPGDGVSRDRLRVFVPEWVDEQLLDPVPGQLTVVFGRV